MKQIEVNKIRTILDKVRSRTLSVSKALDDIEQLFYSVAYDATQEAYYSGYDNAVADTEILLNSGTKT